MGLDIFFEKRKRNYDIEEMKSLENKSNSLVWEIGQLTMSIPEGEELDEFKRLARDIKMFGADVSILDIEMPKEKLEKLNKYVSLLEEVEAVWSKMDGLKQSLTVASFRNLDFLLPHFGYKENLSFVEIERAQVVDLIERCNLVLGGAKMNDVFPPKKKSSKEIYHPKTIEYVKETFIDILNGTNWENEAIDMSCWW